MNVRISTLRDAFAVPFALSVALLAAAGCGVGEAPATPAEVEVPVRLADVGKLPLDVSLRAVGVVAPRDDVRLSFKAPGIVAAVHVREGDEVRAGQLLAELEQAEMDAALRQARAGAAKAQRDLDRARALFADGVATEEQVQDLTTALQMAKASLDSAEFHARFTRIEAPEDGVVLSRLGEPREMVSPGQPLLVLGVTSRGWVVEAAIADRDVVRVKVGDEATVELDAFPGRAFRATVSTIAAAADPATGTYRMKATVEADGARFVQGLVARVRVRDGRREAKPVVPLTALLEADSGRAVVFVVDPAALVARRTMVSTGRFAGEMVEITQGLDGTEKVVVEGAAYLQDGDRVRLVADDAAVAG